MKTVYILIGPQGSGKTYWAKNVLMKHRKDIVRISQDDQGRHGHRELFTKCIGEGKSVVVDRMNFNFTQRDRYLKQLSGKNYKVIFVWFRIDKDVCMGRLAHRKDHPTISLDSDHDQILDFYFEEFEAPLSDEYDELTVVSDKNHATTLHLVNTCLHKKTIIVGDIHGCFDQFMALLEKCKYNPEDIVVSVGDLVDRGPKIGETLRWFRDTPGAYAVMGNHDNKLMRYWSGNPVTINNGLELTIEQCHDFNPVEWSAWLRSLPHMIVLPKIHDRGSGRQLYVVHAGVDGSRSIRHQKIETCLYTRYINGKDAFDKEGGTPWWETLDGSYSVASGHIISEHVRPTGFVYCLDAGAYENDKLRGLVMKFSGHRSYPELYLEEVSTGVV